MRRQSMDLSHKPQQRERDKTSSLMRTAVIAAVIIAAMGFVMWLISSRTEIASNPQRISSSVFTSDQTNEGPEDRPSIPVSQTRTAQAGSLMVEDNRSQPAALSPRPEPTPHSR